MATEYVPNIARNGNKRISLSEVSFRKLNATIHVAWMCCLKETPFNLETGLNTVARVSTLKDVLITSVKYGYGLDDVLPQPPP